MWDYPPRYTIFHTNDAQGGDTACPVLLPFLFLEVPMYDISILARHSKLYRAGFIHNPDTNIYTYSGEDIIGGSTIAALCDDAFLRFIETEITKG